MRGRYSGCHMTIYGYKLPGAVSIARSSFLTDKLTKRAKQKIKILDWCKIHNQNISLASRRFGLDRRTIRSWLKRAKEEGLLGLNDKSHRPHHLRQPTTDSETVFEVVKLRRKYPMWSKYKLATLLKKKSMFVSSSTIGRILKRRGLINKKISQKRRKSALSPKKRFPHGMRISQPGEMIQIDTKENRIIGGRKLFQFTAIDVLTKQRILDFYPTQTSEHGALFLEHCLKEFPFSIKAIQTDNGHEFLKYFVKLCEERNIVHYFTHPRTPKENAYVEISHGADEREFYQQGNLIPDLNIMKIKIKEWQNVWNKIRPHEALDYLTPDEYLAKCQNGRIPTKDVIVLQA